MIRKIDNRRWQRSGTRKFFVAIHREIKPTQVWDKGNRAHQLAHGYDTAATEYCRHSRQSVRSGVLGLAPRATNRDNSASSCFVLLLCRPNGATPHQSTRAPRHRRDLEAV